MVRLTSLALLFFLTALLLAWVDADLRLLKKLDKQIAKVVDVEDLERKELAPPTESFDDERNFYKLISNDSVVGFAVLSRSYGCRVGGCTVYSTTTDKSGSYDPFYYSIVTDKDFVIKNVKVLAFYSEYGYQITSKKWLAQFVGKDGQNLEYEKDIDAISGATISVKSLIDDVELACLSLRNAAQ